VIDQANTATPKIYWVATDHLDRPVLMTDSTRAVVWRALYRPFGEVISITGPLASNAPLSAQRFPGQWFQLETGLAYNWHRHYDASLGRYTQVDPLGLTALLSDGPSVYGYVGQRPTGNVDRSGLQPKDKLYGLPKRFWRWYHRNYKDSFGGDLEKDEACSLYDEWCAAGCPKGPLWQNKFRILISLSEYKLKTKELLKTFCL
jgi:RHS repeat-associated protein